MPKPRPVKPRIGDARALNVRLRPGDWDTLNWLCDELQMSKSDVVKRALASYLAQVTQISR